MWDNEILTWLANPKQREKCEKGSVVALPVEPYNSEQDSVTVTDVLLHAIGKELEHLTKADRDTVVRCLTHARWKHGRRYVGGERIRVFEKPKEPAK